MKVALLTSSRADYGIYLPLIKALDNENCFELDIICFGTHLSVLHGETYKQILKDGFSIAYRIETIPIDDSPLAISESIGKTINNFANLWNNTKYDLIIALGDRYEMFAACASSITFGIPIAHIHGGEITLGAIDDVFRNSITQMAQLHYTTTETYKQRVISMKGTDIGVYNVGALSLDNLNSLKLLSIEEIKKLYDIDFKLPTILITFHPETVEFNKNEEYINELIDALDLINGYQFVITMPNSDTMGNLIRKELIKFVNRNQNAIARESFGPIGYLSCMKHCIMMLGNTSSGFVEASYFPKYVINIGERQLGRIQTPNIISCRINKNEIISAVNAYDESILTNIRDFYGDGKASMKIIAILKSHFLEKL
jgi:GDP/UDP-N,N'-diacetylbacillosamine 2-epimerase (hydrolysing)